MTERGSWAVFDHTADVGVEVVAPTAETLFETAARALFDLLADPQGVQARVERRIRVAGTDLEELLVRWLAELLYLHDVEGLLFARFDVERILDGRLEATASGEPYDPDRHFSRTEIKAVTYHQIGVRRTQEGWTARVVFDV